MFAAIQHFEVSEEDMAVPLTQYYGDRNHGHAQTVPGTNVYIHVNNDEADRILIDPAYKMEKMKEAHEKVYALTEAYQRVEDQFKRLTFQQKVPFGRDMYESWWKIEKSIRKFDRVFNKVEKFNARSMTDPVNHERREKRMLERKSERWARNYTYFFGSLTEEEMQYRDYYQTDVEQNDEDDFVDERLDEVDMVANGQFNPALYDFVDYTATNDAHEDYSDLVEQKLFKYKYRMAGDGLDTYMER